MQQTLGILVLGQDALGTLNYSNNYVILVGMHPTNIFKTGGNILYSHWIFFQFAFAG